MFGWSIATVARMPLSAYACMIASIDPRVATGTWNASSCTDVMPRRSISIAPSIVPT